MRANASFTVEVKARLWNSTLVEDYTSVDRVEIVSKASVIVDPVYTQEVRDFQFSGLESQFQSINVFWFNQIELIKCKSSCQLMLSQW